LASPVYIEKDIVMSVNIIDNLNVKDQNLNRVQRDTLGQLGEGVRDELAVNQRKQPPTILIDV
jgi:hypothetical protein